ncbi:hypothetical protein C8R42DRAFT_647654 [Lentinula raphanica]|nr:hypothetical protein C8R42DRAFT_647654 [Lentinula raphanica]
MDQATGRVGNTPEDTSSYLWMVVYGVGNVNVTRPTYFVSPDVFFADSCHFCFLCFHSNCTRNSGGDDHSTLLKGNRKSLAPAPVNYPENPNKYILLLAVIAGKPVETRRRPVVKFQDMSKERLQQGGSSSTKKDAKDECRSNGDDSEDACTASDWESSDKDLVLAKDPDETVDVDAALQRRA